MSGPLSGIRVVEAGLFQNGPFAAALLADLGADVIKIEAPVTGDPGRGSSVPGYFQAQNRTKRGIALDLSHPAARAVAYRLVSTADVFVQNFRLGVAEKLGLGYADLRTHRPDLIYASVTGLGSEGPDRGLPVMDLVGLARSGFLDLNRIGEVEPTYLMGPGLADQVGAMTFAYAILGALVHRLRTGEGQALEVSQLGSMMLLQNLGLTAFLNSGEPLARVDRRTARNPLWNTYPCADGRWLALGMSQGDRFWAPFCRAVGREDLIAEPRYATMALRETCAAELVAELDRHFRTRPRAEWLARFAAAGLLAAPVQDYAELVRDPQVAANGYLAEIPAGAGRTVRAVGNPARYGASPVTPPGLAPELGQHTEEVLLELGYTWDDLTALRESGAL
jgi:crotonobetainyl-CoA:carnitine CoA-transferase CaiB-like acyl-CoA transferase